MRLVDAARIVPVLDGLDEMPAQYRAQAIAALDAAVGNGRPIVLTCRALEYQDIIAATGLPLARAAVVEIEPVTAQMAAAYLPAGQADGRQRWASVTAALRDDPDGPLARVLSTPLMVYLARTVYTPPSRNPTDLTRLRAADIEEHLLDAYVPAIYGPQTPHRDGNRPRYRPYPPERAQRWLSFLAQHLDQQRTRDLAWWRLVDALPSYAITLTWALVLGISLGVLAGLAEWVRAGPTEGLMSGLTFGSFSACMVVFAERFGVRYRSGEPIRIRSTGQAFGRLAYGLWIGFPFGIMPGIVVGIEVAGRTSDERSSADVLGLSTGLLVVLAVAVAVALSRPAAPDEVASPLSTLRSDSRAQLAAVVGFGITFGLGTPVIAAITMCVPFTLMPLIWRASRPTMVTHRGGLRAARTS